MDAFTRRGTALYAEDLAIQGLAETHGTPLFIYSRAALESHWRACDEALAGIAHGVFYAVKANSNLAVLNVLARLGSGFDIVSAGELERVLAAGGRPDRTVFSGVGKTASDLQRALNAGVRCINVESLAELQRLNSVAGALGVIAPVAVRVNPDVDPQTHPYISTGLKENKFGLPLAEALTAYKKAAGMAHIAVRGVACHIGSQLTQVQPFVDAMGKLLELVDRLSELGIRLDHIDIGGGLGIRYRDECPPDPQQWLTAVAGLLQDRQLELGIEPGRVIAGNAGILVTRVEYLKDNGHKKFAIIDAAMNDLLRPALYQAWQEIAPVEQRAVDPQCYDVVGPVCETADFLGKQRELAIEAGDLLAVRGCGAYSFAMSSNYNSRPRAAEVMVDGRRSFLVRARENLAELYAHERCLPE